MSKTTGLRATSPPGVVPPDRHTAPEVAGPRIALKPRPRLMIALGVALVILLIALLAMYFKTVYPYRNQPHAIETDDDKPAAVSAPTAR